MATEDVLEVLRGRTRTGDALPAPKQVKVFIACDKAGECAVRQLFSNEFLPQKIEFLIEKFQY